MITRMRFVSITVTDLAAATEFYVEKLGFEVLIDTPLPDNNRFVMVRPQGGGSNLVFSLPPAGREHKPSFAISFETDDVNHTFDELTARGVEFTQLPTKTPWGGLQAVFVDPAGNSYMLQAGGL